MSSPAPLTRAEIALAVEYRGHTRHLYSEELVRLDRIVARVLAFADEKLAADGVTPPTDADIDEERP